MKKKENKSIKSKREKHLSRPIDENTTRHDVCFSPSHFGSDDIVLPSEKNQFISEVISLQFPKPKVTKGIKSNYYGNKKK